MLSIKNRSVLSLGNEYVLSTLDRVGLINLAPFEVWHLRLTIHFLADAGNMLDCACLAGIVALRHFRKPEVEVEGDEVIVVSQIDGGVWCLWLYLMSTAPSGNESTNTSGYSPHSYMFDIRPLFIRIRCFNLERTYQQHALRVVLDA